MATVTHPKHKLEAVFSAVLEEMGVRELVGEHRLERPAQREHGHYASTIGLKLFPLLKKQGESALASPRAVAEQIVSKLNTFLAQHDPNLVSEMTIAGPGFINITLTDAALIAQAATTAAGAEHSSAGTHKSTTLIEFVSPNTNKPLHIGHVRNAALGVAMSLIWERQGHSVSRAVIFNDRGLHIIKSMWAYLYLATNPASELTESWQTVLDRWQADKKNWLVPSQLPDERMQKSDHFIGYWYTQADAHEQDTAVTQVWSEMLQAWENEADPQHQAVRALWQYLNLFFYEGFAQTAARLQVRFDAEHENYESAIYQKGKDIVVAGAQAGTFERLDDGAVRVNLEETFKLPNKILLRKDGTGIYMTFDIELARQRSEMGFDQLHWLVGSDQKLYFQQLFAVCELLGFGSRERYHHFAYGMVRLPEGKMSSRKGRVVYADQLLDLAVERAETIMSETHVAKDLSGAERQAVAEAVGVGAVQWTMLSQEPESEMIFDIETSVSFKGFAGPYVQYTAARCASVIANAAKITSIDYSTFDHITQPIDIVTSEHEKSLLRDISSYSDIVERAGQELAPQLLTTYLHELAQSFNALYAELPIVAGLSDANEVEQQRSKLRVMLTAATESILRDGLALLGIRSPEKM